MISCWLDAERYINIKDRMCKVEIETYDLISIDHVINFRRLKNYP